MRNEEDSLLEELKITSIVIITLALFSFIFGMILAGVLNNLTILFLSCGASLLLCLIHFWLERIKRKFKEEILADEEVKEDWKKVKSRLIEEGLLEKGGEDE